MSEQLRELSRPFPDRFVHKNPSGGGSYIKHHVIEQRMIEVLGTPPTFQLCDIIKGNVPAIPPNPNGKSQRAKEGRDALENVVVGVIACMKCEIDGNYVSVDEAGDCEQPHNWDTDGQRLKDAMSDAYKRCAMRLGVGLHLWSQDEFFLFDKLSQASTSLEGSSTPLSVLPENGGRATPEATAEEGNMAPQSAEAIPSADSPSLTEDEQLEVEDLLRLLKEWVGGNDSKHSRVRAEIAKVCLEQGDAPPERIADASLPVLRAVAGVLLTKENA